MCERDTIKYHYKKGNKILHGGRTNNLERREGEHRRTFGPGHIRQVGRRVTRDSARCWERDHGY